MSRNISTPGAYVRRVAMIAALGVAVACTPITRNHGFIPLPEDLSALTIGVDTRDSVIAAVGPATSGGVLGENTLYYVASKFEHFGPFEPTEVDRQVVAMSFNAGGTLSNVERFTLQDGRVVTLSRRVTDDGIADVTVISQLLGSFGQINAGQFLGESGSSTDGI
ncbi:outer membrane protein assembly factor BamE (lipoprotein component of BamABCDE complex) [Loktanella ponticola]|uniref:Outer membrane protein assembly factor BamE (Lipoprotein component of BamABCDE complex) n=1 Tax=Yoonia ponticola TaxID=1524255 RepID=A0A7W9BKJ1_9RHOB|nr:outer membrane protein assembly factor BamE [Yoonia ponticola]MBB5721982.1 outer membrane protein assembly factor BamE (lipoprotein component of BamABCDE complex) [Yoonia ponticola]